MLHRERGAQVRTIPLLYPRDGDEVEVQRGHLQEGLNATLKHLLEPPSCIKLYQYENTGF